MIYIIVKKRSVRKESTPRRYLLSPYLKTFLFPSPRKLCAKSRQAAPFNGKLAPTFGGV